MLLFLITIIGGFLRFYNLLWGDGLFFHPDERNMAISIAQMRLEENLRPHFFAYGQFPTYLAYFSYQTTHFVSNLWSSPSITQLLNFSISPVSFKDGVFWLRFWSALVSTLTIPVVYLITKELINKNKAPSTKSQTISNDHSSCHPEGKARRISNRFFAEFTLRFFSRRNVGIRMTNEVLRMTRNLSIRNLFGIAPQRRGFCRKANLEFSHWAAILAAFTPGLIQAAHFGTTESLLTFLFMVIIYLSLLFLKTGTSFAAIVILSPSCHPERFVCHSDPDVTSGEESQCKLREEPALSLSKGSQRGFFPFDSLRSLRIRMTRCAKFVTGSLKSLFFLAVTTGVALGTKLSAVPFIFAPMIAIALVTKKKAGSIFKKIVVFLLFSIFYLLFSILFLFLTSPYNLLDFQEFYRTNLYEAEVAQGKSPTFYTGQFEGTPPIVYQLTHIFPYALGSVLEILGIIGIVGILGQIAGHLRQSPSLKKKGSQVILVGSFLAYFLPNAFLFCKWTRFMTPIMPMFSVFASYLLFQLYPVFKSFSRETQNSKLPPKARLAKGGKTQFSIPHNAGEKTSDAVASNYSVKLKTFNFLVVVFSFSLLAFSLIPGLLFFSIYLKPDIRVEASEWIYNNIPSESYVLSETANVVDIPITPPGSKVEPLNYQVISFDFYHLEENPELFDKLIDHLEKADYIFVPSQRIFNGRLRLADKYPLAARYYQLLFSGNLGFQKIAQLSRLPDEQAEETWSVFDHPAIRIYKKVKPFSKEKYQRLW